MSWLQRQQLKRCIVEDGSKKGQALDEEDVTQFLQLYLGNDIEFAVVQVDAYRLYWDGYSDGMRYENIVVVARTCSTS